MESNTLFDQKLSLSEQNERTQNYDQKAELKFSSMRMLKSGISWRIAAAAFLTILTVQAVILNFTLKQEEAKAFLHIKQSSLAAIASHIQPVEDDIFASPIPAADARLLVDRTIINGFTIYSNAADPINPNNSALIPIASFGEPMTLMALTRGNLSREYLSSDGNAYEFILRGNDLGHNYTIALRSDSSNVQKTVFNYVISTIGEMLMIALFVTIVLMLTIGYWLLEPILFMRSNLMEASRNPENPNIPKSPYSTDDEIGGAVAIAQKLIHQNSKYVKRVRSAAEDKIHQLAYFDKLTGMPNRTSFLQEIEKLSDPEHEEHIDNFFILALDLDHFKDINDTMGHNAGDSILKTVGKRLRSSLPDSTLVSRTGEDEFALMIPNKAGAIQPSEAAEKILNLINTQPIHIMGEELQIRASMGVVKFPQDGKEADHLLKSADIALNRAKEEGRNRFMEYSADFDRAVKARFQMMRDLREGIEKEQFRVFYQPQLNLHTGKIIGAEALIRWWKPDNSKEGGQYIRPDHFIPLAEQSGLIVPIGSWVMRTAIEQTKAMNDKYNLDTRIAVNVSGEQFTAGNLVSYVDELLKETGFNPHKLELEVTESIFMDDIEYTIQVLKDLHALGIELAIDDFGTGYSSLSYLRQFPIDRLKVDQSFIRNALNNADDASITKTIVALGHSLNLSVIAEGVETREHEKFLRDMKCDEVQGYRYCRPVIYDEYVDFCTSYNGDLKSFDKD